MRTGIHAERNTRLVSLELREGLRLALVGTLVAACGGGSPPSGFVVDNDGGSGGTVSSSGNDSGSATTPTGPVPVLGVGEAGPPDAGGACTSATGTADNDGDGWSPAEGDSDDCNKFINPGAYDIPADSIDEDSDGKVDDEPTGCDSTLSGVATTSGSDGAKALDLCRSTTQSPLLPQKTWGVISADYVLPDSTTTASSNINYPLGFGILGPSFGKSNPTQQGVRMLGLSSGTARQPTDTGYQDVSGFDKGYTSGAPTGFPGQTPACGNVTFGAPHDGAALSLVVRVPTNALTMSFDSNFFSYEFPQFVCSEYNDTYVVIMTPSPPGEPSTANDNIAFDSKGNIISVNAGFLQVCDPSVAGGYTCPEGASKLTGTGFGIDTTSSSVEGDDLNHASTDWLTTTVSVAPLAGQKITLLFAMWDSSDGVLDSTVLVDNVRWTFATLPDTAPPATTPPVTVPK